MAFLNRCFNCVGVLPGHIPLLTALAAGPLTYFEGSAVTRYAVQGGFAEVLPDRVTILATVAKTADDIDLVAAKHRLEEAQGKLKDATADELASERRRQQQWERERRELREQRDAERDHGRRRPRRPVRHGLGRRRAAR